MMASSKHKVLLTVLFLLVLTVGIVLFLYMRTDEDEVVTALPERAALSGTYECLTQQEGIPAASDGCVPGLLTEDGSLYALDFNLLAAAQPELMPGVRMSAGGIVTPLENLSTEYWQQFGVTGIFSVTDSLQVEEQKQSRSEFEGTLPCADCPGIETVLTLYEETEDAGRGSYTLSLTYIDRTAEPFVEQGAWMLERGNPLDPDAIVYALYRDGGDAASGRYLKVDDTTIRQLMLDGSPIESNLSFDLHRVESE